jgi:hypothetical protein
MIVICGSVMPTGSSGVARYWNQELSSASLSDVRRGTAVRPVAVVSVPCCEMIATLRANASACCGLRAAAADNMATPRISASDALKAIRRYIGDLWGAG